MIILFHYMAILNTPIWLVHHTVLRRAENQTSAMNNRTLLWLQFQPYHLIDLFSFVQNRSLPNKQSFLNQSNIFVVVIFGVKSLLQTKPRQRDAGARREHSITISPPFTRTPALGTSSRSWTDYRSIAFLAANVDFWCPHLHPTSFLASQGQALVIPTAWHKWA